MESIQDNNRLAAVEAILAETAKQMANFEQERKRFRADFEQEIKRSQAAFEQERKQSRAAFDLEMQKISKMQAENAKQIGGMGNSQGKATTELFYNSLKYGEKKMFGEAFDDVFKEESRQTKKGFEDEYDILMFNGQAVCIVEVKYKADTNDVQQVLRKEKTFRANFPEHHNKRLYLALASRSFHKKTEEACQKNGIAIMKQVGGTVVVNDEHLKMF